jgi:hypothetical protein
MKETFLTCGIVFLFLFLVSNLAIYFRRKQERFEVLDIITDQMKNEERYQKCLDQNQLINRESKGKYQSCHQAVQDISRWGMGADANIGYGKMGDVCPVSCLLSTPAKCLEDKVQDQKDLLNKMEKQEIEYNVTGFDNLRKITSGLDDHSHHINNLYQKEYVQNFLAYQNSSGAPVSDELYNQIVQQHIANVSGEAVSDGKNNMNTPQPTLYLETVD